MNIKQPTRVDRWVSSDGREHQNEDAARCQEVFLSVIQVILPAFEAEPSAMDRRRIRDVAHPVIIELAKHYDFVPRK